MGSGDSNEQPRAFKGDFKYVYNFQKVPFSSPFYQKKMAVLSYVEYSFQFLDE